MTARGLAAPLLVAVAVLVPTAAVAGWSAHGSGTATARAATMANASALRVTCTFARGSVELTLAWTASPSTYVDAYEIGRVGSGGATSWSTPVRPTPATATTYTDPVASGTGFTYAYTVRAASGSWRTAMSSPVSITLPARNTCPP
jgi:hypothetical protein